MNILVLKSSGHKNGSSNTLADEFIKGAKENGHSVTDYDVFNADIKNCRGCDACRRGSGKCVNNDDYENELKGMIKSADMLVFVMPLYYYSWPAALKTVVDRFYSFSSELSSMGKKTVIIAAAWENSTSAFEVTKVTYEKIGGYLNFKDCGMLFAGGCPTVDVTKSSKHMQMAYEMGRNL